MTRALGMCCGRGHQSHHPLGKSIPSAPWGLGPSHFRAGRMRHFLLGLCRALQLKAIPAAQPLDAAHSLPLPCSLLTLLWHHTLSVLSAARGPQVPSVQHCQRLFCALKVPGGSRGPLPRTVVWLVLTASLSPEPGAVLPRRRLRAAAGDPPECNLQGMEMGTGVLWVPVGGRDARDGIPGLWTCPCA